MTSPPFTNTPQPPILTLGDRFYDPVKAASFPSHKLRYRNQAWAQRLGLGALSDEAWLHHFGMFQPLPHNLEKPLALRYHGHQFRSYNPRLGDGRGFLYAQLQDPVNERWLDLGTKGSGRTPWSRGGDGRLTLKGGVREVLATALLEALGVYTSKTFSLIETGEALHRTDEPSPTRSSVMVRLSHSHIRFGSFQRLAHLEDEEGLSQLLDYCTTYLLPALDRGPDRKPATDFLAEVMTRTIELCASWMAAGFIHGVLNTDNMSITGESFDYGPYRFLPTYQPGFTAAYFDHAGLYAFGRQPEAVLWNLEQLAIALLPLGDADAYNEVLNTFGPRFVDAFQRKTLHRLGLQSQADDADDALLEACFLFLRESQVDYGQFFFDWYGGNVSQERAQQSPQASAYQGPLFEKLLAQFERFQTIPSFSLEHPFFQQAKNCNLLIDEIEWIWDAIDKDDDWSRFEQKIEQIQEMGRAYGRAPAKDQRTTP